ncbi:MAG: molybdopterin converting factor subunit 1 [Pseudomonadota bacterium]
MRILYFAWIRQKIGRASDELELPVGITTVGELIGYLAGMDSGCAQAFMRPDLVRVAIDQVFCDHDAQLSGAKEIAFFPPVTGG